MYKIENTIADIKLIHPEVIAPRFIIDDDTVKLNGIILSKPYKLQITAVGKSNGKKKKRKRVIEYSSTLKEAVSDAIAKRNVWLRELKREITSKTTTDIEKITYTIEDMEQRVKDTTIAMQTANPSDIPTLATELTNHISLLEQEKQKLQRLESEVKNDGAITEMITLNDAFELYVKAQHIKFKAKKVSREYAENRYRGLYDKHIRNAIGSKLLDNIDKEDVQEIVNNMFVSRAKLDSNGNKIPVLNADGNHKRYTTKKKRSNGNISVGAHGHFMYEMETRPASQRTKRSIYMLVNPIYSYVNGSNKIKYTVPSPATTEGLEPLENDRVVKETIEAFTKLYNYHHPYYQKVFVWLMHGRRFGEVASLEYSDIDFENNTYTIRAINNKAKVDMTYILTKWQLETLNPNTISGLVFPSITDTTKQINSGTITSNHWFLNCSMHDVRHIIGNELINKEVSIEVIGRILGHKPKKNIITNTYAKVSSEKANTVLTAMLEPILIKED